MKTNIINPLLLPALIAVLNFLPAQAGDMPITAGGWNRDVIVERIAVRPYTGAALPFDVPNNYGFYEAGLPAGRRGLPSGRSFTSLVDGSTVFQLQPYNSNNVLQLSASTSSTGTLTLATPAAYSSISVLAASANSYTATVGNLVLHFSDGTTSPTLKFNNSDWFFQPSPAIQGFGRLVLTAATAEDDGNSYPELYQTTINLAALGVNNKAVVSIEFLDPSTDPRETTGIFAISGTLNQGPPGQCDPPPSGLVAWWPGEGNVNNFLGGNNGTLEGSATISGGALHTTAVAGGLRGGVPQNGVMLPASAVAGITNAFTIETWFVANFGGGYTTLFSFSDSTLANYIIATPARGNFPYASTIAVIGGGGSWTGPGDIQASEQYQDNGILHDMVVTYDGNTLSYYIDGALGSYSGLSPTITDPGLNLSTLTRIGINGGSPWPDNSINGSTLDFRIYGQALTPPQVASIYALGADASNSAISAVLANAAASSPAQLLHRYNFSTDASDSVGANNGTLLNGAGFSTGKVGLGMHFNGHSQCVSVPNSSSLHAANYSVEAWVEPLAPIPAAIGQTLIFGQNGGVSQLVLRPGSTGVRVVWQFARGDGSFPEVDSTTEIPIGQFSHLAGTWDGTTLKLFIDGVLNAQSTPGATPWDSGCEFFIGGFYDNTSSRCRYVGEFFVGTIDELSVYNRALSSNEIAAIYAAGRAGKCTTVSPPVILTEPFSQTNNVGTDASFSVLALGTAPLGYQWSKDGTTIPGGTNATLVLTSVQKTDQGYYSVVVSNPYGTATNSSAFLYVNRPPVADASATLTVVISSDGISAALLLDGTRSSDPDGDPLRYEWYEAGNASPLANGAVAEVLLPVGSHSRLLVVSDDLAQATNAFPVEVITTAQAVAQLAAAVNTSVPRSRSLQATLSAAEASIARGNFISAINQLNAFQNQVRAQLSRQDPATAAALIQAAQEVIEALSGGNTNPGDRRHGAVTGVNRQVNGR